MTDRKNIFSYLILLLILLAVSSIYLFSGHIDYRDPETVSIIYLIRLPRLLMVILTGGALTTAGLCFQSLLRNPLATPYTLGVSSGSAFGAVIAIKLKMAGLSTPFSMIAGIITILVVYRISKIKGRFTIATLLLSGISLSFFFSGMILFIHYISDFTQSAMMIRWMMGGFEAVTFNNIYLILPFVIIFTLYIFFRSRDLNLMCLGDEIAQSRGVNVSKLQKNVFIIASLLTASIISITGPIGFVGLIVPHITRYIKGQDHRTLIPFSFIAGGIFLLFADFLAKSLILPASIPVGVLTSVMGGPFFLVILYRSKRMLYL